MTKRAELLSSVQAYDGRVVDLRVDTVRLPNGVESELEIIRHTGASAVVPVTADGDVVLVRQYRHATDDWLLEVPAGTLEGGSEDPELCARRELEEETGFRAGTLVALGWIWTTPGFTDEKIWLFLAQDLEACEQRLEADEVLDVEVISLQSAANMCLTGKIKDGKTICALLKAVYWVDRLSC